MPECSAQMTEEIQKYAEQLGFLADLSDDNRRAALAVCELQDLSENNVIFNQEDPSDGLYFLAEGEVSLTRFNRSGQSFDLARLEAGDAFGEIGVLDQGRRLVTARSLTKVRLIFLSAKKLEEMLERREVAALELLHLLSLFACRRIRDMNRRIVDAIHDPGATINPAPGGQRAPGKEFFQGLMAELFIPARDK